MKNFNLILFTFLLLTVVTAQAALYKGQRVYSKVCMKCHTSGESFIGKKTQYEWAMYTSKNAEKLVKEHLASDKFKAQEKYKKYKKYFESKRFRKNTKHLKQFLMEYAKDSGNVAACS